MMNLGHVLGCVSTISTEYLSYNALTTSEHSYFMAFPDLGSLQETDLRLRCWYRLLINPELPLHL
jgi:hypothetical protein